MFRRDRLLSELLAVIGEALENDQGDGYELMEGVRAWLGVATGQGQDVVYWPGNALQVFHTYGKGAGDRLTPADRARKALELVQKEGKVTSGKLAKAAGVHPETARLTLAEMAKRGTLKQCGSYRKTFYKLA